MLEEAVVLRPAVSLHPRASAPWRSRGCFQQQRAQRGSWIYMYFIGSVMRCSSFNACSGHSVWFISAEEEENKFSNSGQGRSTCTSVTSGSALHTSSLLTRARCCISSTVSGITTTLPQVSILSTFSCLIPILVYPILKYVPQSLDMAAGEKQAAVAWHGGELLTLKLAPNPKVLYVLLLYSPLTSPWVCQSRDKIKTQVKHWIWPAEQYHFLAEITKTIPAQ